MVNKKKKRRAPLARITFFIILILGVGFFIFYSIDNPQFLRNLFNTGGSGEVTTAGNGDQDHEEEALLDEEIDTSTSNDAAEGEVSQELMDESGSDETDSSLEEVSEADISAPEESGSLSFWQRILAFFSDRARPSENEDTYPSRLTVNIYFASTGQEKMLVPEERSIIAGNPEIALNNAMNELLKGPVKSYHFPVIPAGTELLRAKVYDGVAEIDLSKEFLENSLDSRILDEYIIYSIVNTVTEISDIDGVIFFMEGKRIKMYGIIDLSIPLIRDPDLLKVNEE